MSLHLPSQRPPVPPARTLSVDDLLSAFQNAPVGMAVVSPGGAIIACNTAMGALLQRDPDGLVGGTFFDVTHPDDVDGARASCAFMHDGRIRLTRHECRFVRADTGIVWVSVSTSGVPEQPDRPAHLIMHIEDITERKDLEAELHHRAWHDPLTGLANRDLLIDRLERILPSGSGDSRPGDLFYLDLDGFKAVNDDHGHAAGDEILTQLAVRITALLGPDDTAARLGGDEFAVLRTDLDPDDAIQTVTALRAAAAQPFPVGPLTITLSAAVGHIAVLTSSTLADAGHYLAEADHRMYAIKKRRARG